MAAVGQNGRMEPIARFSDCRRYRYTLWRTWSGNPGYVMFVGLNPSTADEVRDDPTVRRCIGFAKSWGFGAMCMTNLFAFRATKPEAMKAAKDPVGPENDRHLRRVARKASLVVAAWGVHGTYLGREAVVRGKLPRLHCLGLTRDGLPKHPLYLPRGLKPALWTAF